MTPSDNIIIAKNVIENDPYILFLGAGVSYHARDNHGNRLPTWPETVSELFDLLKKSGLFPERAKKEIERLWLENEFVIVSEVLDKYLDRGIYREYFANRFGEVKPSEAHRRISNTKAKLYITTNYDDLLEKSLKESGKNPRVIVPHYDEFSIDRVIDACRTSSEELYVFKAHGCYKRPETLDLFQSDMRLIMHNNEPFASLMSQLYSQFSFIFFGYSFRDQNFKYLLQKIVTQNQMNMKQHFATMANAGIATSLYLESNFNVTALPYVAKGRDHSDFKRIFNQLIPESPYE